MACARVSSPKAVVGASTTGGVSSEVSVGAPRGAVTRQLSHGIRHCLPVSASVPALPVGGLPGTRLSPQYLPRFVPNCVRSWPEPRRAGPNPYKDDRHSLE